MLVEVCFMLQKLCSGRRPINIKSTALTFSSEHHITPLCLGGLLHLSFIQVAKHELENQHQGS